jgi:anaerobic selenocysteine-containing dehydrogenase
LPCLGRTETDQQKSGPQFVTVENSMSVVHSSEGRLTPASPDLLSETAIVCRIAEATLGKQSTTPWNLFEGNYEHIRNSIEKVIPEFENFNQRVKTPGGFYLPNHVKGRVFKTASGKAEITINPLNPIQLEDGQLLLQTFRSHDQYNTTIYGNNDRYRGIKNERRVLFMNPADMQARGIAVEQPVDITSHFNGETRTAELFLAIPYDTPSGCVAAYYPEANVLVPLSSRGLVSHTPTSKSIIVTVYPHSV